MLSEHLTFEDLPKAMSHLIQEIAEIKQFLLNAPGDNPKGANQNQPLKKILTVEDVSKILEMKRGSIYNLTHKRAIPFYKRGQRVFFDRGEIEKWIRSDKRKTIEELRNEADIKAS